MGGQAGPRTKVTGWTPILTHGTAIFGSEATSEALTLRHVHGVIGSGPELCKRTGKNGSLSLILVHCLAKNTPALGRTVFDQVVDQYLIGVSLRESLTAIFSVFSCVSSLAYAITQLAVCTSTSR